MKTVKSEKKTLRAMGDEELGSVCGGSKNTLEEMKAAGYLKALAKVAGEGTLAGTFFEAASNKMQDLAILNA